MSITDAIYAMVFRWGYQLCGIKDVSYPFTTSLVNGRIHVAAGLKRDRDLAGDWTTFSGTESEHAR
jgi:hypothetical protein